MVEPPASQDRLRAACLSDDGEEFEAEVLRAGPVGVFLQVDRPLSHDDRLQVTLLSRGETLAMFSGMVTAWVKGKGVRVEAIPGTPAEVLDRLTEITAQARAISPSTDLALRADRGSGPLSPGARVSTSVLPGAVPSARTALAGARVLVIDDDPGIVRMLDRALRRFGCEVTGTQDPPQGLEWFALNDVDAVLLDWMLPRIPGAEMLERLRAVHHEMPVAVMSGALWWDHAADDIRAQGAHEVLEKPIDFVRLIGWLQSVVAQGKSMSPE